MISLIQGIIEKFINIGQEIFEYIFSGVDFSVLWSWLPNDIQIAASTFIVILFVIALIKGVRNFLPF